MFDLNKQQRRTIPKWLREGDEQIAVNTIMRCIKNKSKEEQLDYLIKVVQLLKNKMARIRGGLKT